MAECLEFRFEKELVAVLRDKFPAALNSEGHTCPILDGIQIGERIPDLLIVSSRPGPQWTPRTLSYFDCAIVATTMESGAVTVANLADRTYSPPAEIASRVERLVRFGLLTHSNGAEVRVLDDALPRDVSIVAVEAKLTRWRDALVQAQEYLAFANEAYVAMPSSVVQANLDSLDACAQTGIGMIAVDEAGATIMLNANRRHPKSAQWVRLVSRAVGVSQTLPTLPRMRHAKLVGDPARFEG